MPIDIGLRGRYKSMSTAHGVIFKISILRGIIFKKQIICSKQCKGREATCRRILVDEIKAAIPSINKNSSFIWAGLFQNS